MFRMRYWPNNAENGCDYHRTGSGLPPYWDYRTRQDTTGQFLYQKKNSIGPARYSRK
jgi:hypothetical protein